MAEAFVGEVRLNKGWVIGSGSAVLAIVAIPLWEEFKVPGDLVWNIFLALFLVGLVVAALLLQLYFWEHRFEVGEARFDTRNDRQE